MIKTVKTYSRLNWTPEEEKYLKELAQSSIERCWKKIAEQINALYPEKSRSGKQCRERYMNFARFDSSSPKIIGWTKEEDQQLFQEFVHHGPKWTQMSQKFIGRSENCLKNRFNGALRKIARKLNKGSAKKKAFQNKTIKSLQLFKILLQANQLLIQTKDSQQQNQIQKVASMKEIVNCLIKFSIKQDGMLEEEEKIEFFKVLNYYYSSNGRKGSQKVDSTSTTQILQSDLPKKNQIVRENTDLLNSLKLSIDFGNIQIPASKRISKMFSQELDFLDEQASYQNNGINLLWLQNKSLENQLNLILKEDFGLTSLELLKN